MDTFYSTLTNYLRSLDGTSAIPRHYNPLIIVREYEQHHQQEMERMKKEIIEEVMSRITVTLDETAVNRLRDAINQIGS